MKTIEKKAGSKEAAVAALKVGPVTNNAIRKKMPCFCKEIKVIYKTNSQRHRKNYKRHL